MSELLWFVFKTSMFVLGCASTVVWAVGSLKAWKSGSWSLDQRIAGKTYSVNID